MSDGKSQSPDGHRKMKVGNVSARAKRKQQQSVDGSPSLIPWATLLKWGGAAIGSLAVLGAVGYLVYHLATAPPPADLAKCPVIDEVAGSAVVAVEGKQAPSSVTDPVLPSSTLRVGDASTIRLTYPDKTILSFYSGSAARFPDDYSPSVFLKNGSAYVEVKGDTPFVVNTPYGEAVCFPGTIASVEVAQSRTHVDVRTGYVQLTSVRGKRRLMVIPDVPGEVGIGADTDGIQGSEADVDITYPGLEIKDVSMYDAEKDHVLTAFNPLTDGSIFKNLNPTAPLLDFQIKPNSSKTVYIEVELFRIDKGTATSIVTHRSEPVKGKTTVFPAFGAEIKDDKVDFTGHPIPLGDYQLKVTPFADDKAHGIGNGRSLTLRFSIDDKQVLKD